MNTDKHGWKAKVLLPVLLLLGVSLWGQRPPVIRPPELPAAGSGIPKPAWLGRGKTITGHIAGIDPDRILVHTFEFGDVLFLVDEKTIVRVDKTRLSLVDLREGDPVAVHLKEIKDKGPYATEILPHPEVLRRKEKGGPKATAPESPAENQADPIRNPQSAIRNVEIPSLPRGQKGVTGTVTEVREDQGNAQATVETPDGSRRSVLVTPVTRIVRSGSAPGKEQLLSELRAEDRVAVAGDILDSGVLVAREIWVNRSATVEAAATPVTASSSSESMSGEFTGTIVALETEGLRVRTPEGRERHVLVTPVTIIRRWGTEVTFSSVRKGDQVSITGDVLEGGDTLARVVNVTKPASSR